MIKAVIFDCFGVLTSDGWLPFKQKYFGSDPVKFEEVTRLNALANSDRISFSQFLTTVSEMAGVSYDELNHAMHKSVRNDDMLEIVKELKSSYKIGMLSNISGDWLSELFTKEQIALFDSVALSYETGFAKPDTEAYKVIIDRLRCNPGECVYIDDQQVFVDVARTLGMPAIHFKEYEQFKVELTEILKMSNSDK